MRKLKIDALNDTRQDKAPTKEFSEINPKINFVLNADLVEEIRQWLTANYRRGLRRSAFLGEFCREALQHYKNGLIKLDWEKRPKGKKTNITIRFPSNDLNFYLTLPKNQRTVILELSMLDYYQQKKAELEEKG